MKKMFSVILTALMLLSVLPFSVFAEGEVRSVHSYEEMTAYVRGELTARSETVRFRYEGSDYREPTLDDLCAYGGDAHAGDYLRLSFRTMPKTVEENGVYTVSASFYTDAGQEAAVDAYVEDALAACPDGTDYEKAEYIYDYLCENVLFDLENLNNEQDLLKYTAYGAAVNGRAVCQGFAALYYRLALAAGLDCRVVTGTRSDVKHAWNIVKWDGKWYHVDASSGSQFIDASAYFMKARLRGYLIEYGDYTAPEIEEYPFAPAEDEIITGSIDYLLSYSLNVTTGLLRISGSGTLPEAKKILSDADRPYVSAIDIEDGITGIAAEFWRWPNLRRISIAASVTDIPVFTPVQSSFGDGVYKNYVTVHYTCPLLETIEVDERNPVYHSNLDCLIKTTDKEVVIGSADGDIPADGSVASIGERAYAYINAEEITVPEGVVSIGQHAFFSCENLKRITFGDGVLSLANSAVGYCEKLESVILPDSLEHIGSQAFSNDGSLKSVTLPASLKTVDDIAFLKCGLTQLRIPDRIAELGDRVFKLCPLESVTIGAGVSAQINGNLFDSCASLREFIVEEGNACYSVDENGILFNRDKTELIKYPAALTASSYTIPDGVKKIGESAFTASDTFDEKPFFINESLESITIPPGVEEIGLRAFNGCKNLKRVNIRDLNAWFAIRFPDPSFFADDRYYSANPLYNDNAVLYLNGEPLTELTVPDGVTSIGNCIS